MSTGGNAHAQARSLVPSKKQRQLRVPVGLIVRITIAVVAVLVNVAVTGSLQLLPWASVLVLVDITASYLLDGPVPILRSNQFAEWAAVSMAGLASAGAVGVGPGALLLLLVPASMAGQRLRPLGASLLTALVLVTALLVASRRLSLTSASAVTFHQILALVSIGAFLIAWGVASRTTRTSEEQVRAAEASEMLEQLTALARGFDRGFDGPAYADEALAELLRAVPAEGGVAIVADLQRQPQTWAVTGTARQTWPEVDTPDSPLAPAWGGTSVAVPRWRDAHGRDRAILAVPLRARDGSPIGVLLADRQANQPFTDAELVAGRRAARHHEPFIELASLFAWLRDQALREERDRLSRQIHDGIGQEIAALGYQLDAAKLIARHRDPELESLLADVRASLSDVASDVRLQISDLRRAGPAIPRAHLAIEARLAAFRTATGIQTSSQLDPTPDQLGAGAELALYRVVAAVLRDASDGAPTRVSLRLATSPDTVTLVACHNGRTHLTPESLAPHTAMVPGADVTIPERSDYGVVVRVVLLVPQRPVAARHDEASTPRPITVADEAEGRRSSLQAKEGDARR